MNAHPPSLRAALLVPVVLTVALLAASCADTPGPDPLPAPPPATERVPTGAPPQGPPDRPVPVPDPLTSTPPSGGTALPADRVDTSGLPQGFPTLVWSRDARTIGVYGRAGGCTEADVQVTSQAPDEVVVTVSQETTSPGPCTRELLYPPLEVTLSDDLGDRRVVLGGEVR